MLDVLRGMSPSSGKEGGVEEDDSGDNFGVEAEDLRPYNDYGGKRRNKSKKNGKKSNKRQTRKANK